MNSHMPVPEDLSEGELLGAANFDSINTMTESVPDGDSLIVPLIEERVEAGKRMVDRGGYRITKHVATRQESADELLRDHRVVVERRPIGRVLAGADVPQQRYEGDVLIIPVLEEVLITEKRMVLVEEVRITCVDSTHRSPHQVTLRREEISIERLEPSEPSQSQAFLTPLNPI